MLDDLKYIHHRDGQDALGIAEHQAEQLGHQFDKPELGSGFANVVYAGMGGSALAALVARSWPGINVPFEICRRYDIPKYVSEKTLFIASSYSGNTEEILSTLAEAEAKKATVVIISQGGKLSEIAKAKNYPALALPDTKQPRFAVLASLKALATILEKAGLTDGKVEELVKTTDFLKKSVEAWLPTGPTKENPAKRLAEELAGKSVAVYGGPLMAPAAYKWKINFNENAKNVAWWNELPEFDHNELSGWTSHPILKPYAIIELRSNFEHPRVQKRFEVGEKLLSGRRPAPYVVAVQGGTLLEQLVWVIAYGDFVSIYLALLNGINPSPVDIVEKFKKELG